MLIWSHKYLLFDGAGSGQGSRTQMDSKLLYHYMAPSSICMPGIIVLVMNCRQRELYEAICIFKDIHKIDVSKYRTSNIDGH